MSVLIKGMEMPKNEPLLVKINPDGSVSTTARNGYKKYEAIPVPPHGRLKDYDRIMKEYDEWFSKTESREYENMFYALRMAINGSPTIIRAEEVYGQYTDTTGNFHWCGTHSGEHRVKAEEGET